MDLVGINTRIQIPKLTIHQMKELLQERDIERQKPIDHVTTLTAEKDALETRVKFLEEQMNAERSARDTAEAEKTKLSALVDSEKVHCEAAGKAKENLSKELAAERKMLEEAKHISLELKKNLEVAELKQTEAEKQLQDYRILTAAKLNKAKAFYASQKELLGLQVKNCEPERKEAILKAFEEEYGELARE